MKSSVNQGIRSVIKRNCHGSICGVGRSLLRSIDLCRWATVYVSFHLATDHFFISDDSRVSGLFQKHASGARQLSSDAATKILVGKYSPRAPSVFLGI